MLKGAQKRMVVVKTQDSRIFEEAYFVMRGEPSASGEDIIREANKIIDNCTCRRGEKRKRLSLAVLGPICAFMGGSILGSGITLAVMLIAG